MLLERKLNDLSYDVSSYSLKNVLNHEQMSRNLQVLILFVCPSFKYYHY